MFRGKFQKRNSFIISREWNEGEKDDKFPKVDGPLYEFYEVMQGTVEEDLCRMMVKKGSKMHGPHNSLIKVLSNSYPRMILGIL